MNVITIPAKPQKGNAAAKEEVKRLRVAAYCRFSTDNEEQASSYESQNYDDITEEILRLRELQAQADMDGTAKSEHKKRIRELLKFIERQTSKVLAFDESLVRKLLEKVTVYDDYLEFHFKSGVTVSVKK